MAGRAREPTERVLGLRRRCVRLLSEIEAHSRAIAAGTALLADWERVAGTDHPDTLTSWYSLAVAYHDAWDLNRALSFVAEHHPRKRHGEALELYQRALADRAPAFAVGVLPSDRYQLLVDDVRQAMRRR